jgi:hypothetical protein
MYLIENVTYLQFLSFFHAPLLKGCVSILPSVSVWCVHTHPYKKMRILLHMLSKTTRNHGRPEDQARS